ncbi:MAG: F0F1 ATP synthase subunit epsilon [Oscillospiraceae bacterium]|nr:F0F1 ATP synthase subunit epsilon [Oscillospiraceae bacterium]
MDDRIHLQIVTPAEIVVDQQARYVRLPLEGGSIGVLHGHAPLLGAVTAGVLKYSCGDRDFYAAVGDGVAHVTGEEVTVLVRSAACADSADEARQAARQMKKK